MFYPEARAFGNDFLCVQMIAEGPEVTAFCVQRTGKAFRKSFHVSLMLCKLS